MFKLEDFNFTGKALEDIDLPRIGHKIGVGEDIVHATIDVETGGRWTDSKGRLPMLYEPHVAYRNSSGAKRAALVKAGLAYPSWGEKPYPKDSYPNFMRAYAIDPDAALKACSWGGPQILGENYALAGFVSPEAMVKAFLADQDQQLEGMINFIIGANLDDELQTLQAKMKRGEKITATDCIPFVRGYNGKGYAKNGYHTKYAAALNKWIKIPDTPWSPDKVVVEDITDGKFHEELKAIQTTLDEIGYPEVGGLDGKWGTKTRTAVLSFRADNGLPLVDTEARLVDAEFLTKLALRPQRPVAPARANATIADLRAKGAEDVKQLDVTQIVGGVVAAGGGLTALTKAVESVEQYSGLAKRFVETAGPMLDLVSGNLWVLAAGAGAAVVWQSGVLKKIRLGKHQTGEDVSE